MAAYFPVSMKKINFCTPTLKTSKNMAVAFFRTLSFFSNSFKLSIYLYVSLECPFPKQRCSFHSAIFKSFVLSTPYLVKKHSVNSFIKLRIKDLRWNNIWRFKELLDEAKLKWKCPIYCISSEVSAGGLYKGQGKVEFFRPSKILTGMRRPGQNMWHIHAPFREFVLDISKLGGNYFVLLKI